MLHQAVTSSVRNGLGTVAGALRGDRAERLSRGPRIVVDFP